MLWHYATGSIPCYLAATGNAVGWVKYSHRGVQFLDKVDFPRKEKRYIFSPKFEVRYNQRFEEVLQNCADGRKEGRTWISPEVFEGYMNMYRAGFAHSYETWEGGKLVGGAIGVQIGGYVTCETMYHHVSNASKAAWGQTLVRLKERGFKWVDTNCVAAHHVNYGEEWLPQWRFEVLLAEALRQTPTLGDDIPCAPLPGAIKAALPLARFAGKVARRLNLRQPAPQPAQAQPPAPAPAPAPAAAEATGAAH
jgi:leucyl/phenylalanyl-tRNA--protein transferase